MGVRDMEIQGGLRALLGSGQSLDHGVLQGVRLRDYSLPSQQ